MCVPQESNRSVPAYITTYYYIYSVLILRTAIHAEFSFASLLADTTGGLYTVAAGQGNFEISSRSGCAISIREKRYPAKNQHHGGSLDITGGKPQGEIRSSNSQCIIWYTWIIAFVIHMHAGLVIRYIYTLN